MTEFELLSLLGNADDDYIMASRRRPKKHRPVWPKVLAACLAVAIIGGVGFAGNFVRNFHSGGYSASSAMDETIAAEEAMPEMQDTEGAKAPSEAVASDKPMSAYDVTLLAGAEYPASVSYNDYESLSEIWQNNRVTDETSMALNTFAYSTAAAVLRDKVTSGCYSPISLYHALSVLASGAGGDTATELLSLLGQSDKDTLREETGKLYRRHYRDDGITTLQIANSLWLDDTDSNGNKVGYKQDWVLSAAADYYADVFQAEFSDGSAAEALGQWVADHTGGLLHPTAEDLGVNESTQMAILNTLYFKTCWSEPFDTADTDPDTFTDEDGMKITVDFMHRTDSLGMVVETEDYTKSTLGMAEGQMYVVLPKEGVDVDSLLTEEKLWEIFENGDYSTAKVNWSVPKFVTDSNYDLTDTLKSLGVRQAFDTSADFSDISDNPLYVTTVRQGTHLSVYEEGLEAAAYTNIGMEAAGAPMEDEMVVEMNLNRPFLYAITANDGSILFLGVVRNPVS